MIDYTLRHRVRFVQYTAIGLVAFSFDLLLLYLLTTYATAPYWVAVPLAFLVATSTHYVFLRILVYHDSVRPLGEGYALFLLIMCSNALVVTGLVVVLVEYLGASVYIARIGVAGLVGIGSFFLNAKFNFKIT